MCILELFRLHISQEHKIKRQTYQIKQIASLSPYSNVFHFDCGRKSAKFIYLPKSDVFEGCSGKAPHNEGSCKHLYEVNTNNERYVNCEYFGTEGRWVKLVFSVDNILTEEIIAAILHNKSSTENIFELFKRRYVLRKKENNFSK